jgi:hypothetical protein
LKARNTLHLIEDELDIQSSDSEEKTDDSEEETITDSEEETNTFFQTRHFDYIVGITLGFLLGLGTSILLQ